MARIAIGTEHEWREMLQGRAKCGAWLPAWLYPIRYALIIIPYGAFWPIGHIFLGTVLLGITLVLSRPLTDFLFMYCAPESWWAQHDHTHAPLATTR